MDGHNGKQLLTIERKQMRWGNEGRDGMFFAFGHQRCAPTEQPAATKLQQLLQQVYAAEGTLRTGAMYILPEDLV